MAQMPSWIRIELARRARPTCPDCHGTGVVTYTARNISGEEECACECVEKAMANVAARDLQKAFTL